MPDLSFDRMCTFLATTHGGYTVWLGAGAAMALTKGGAPSWTKLVDDLTIGHRRPQNWDSVDYPSKLDWVSSELGHAAFRKALRTSLVGAMLTAPIDEEVAKSMAVIGARAGAIVSFNIEMLSSLPMAISRGGSFIFRSYRRPESESFMKPMTDGGMTCSPVFLPHGLLDMEGNCVITKSEYLAHGMSLAVGTAVNACLGGDLLILGMSLDDGYLREAILEHRRWIRDVFWVTNSRSHAEWARVAKVHRVAATYEQTWTGIAKAHLAHDSHQELRAACAGEKGFFARAIRGIPKAREYIGEFENIVRKAADDLLEGAHYAPRNFATYARQCEDLGFDVPEAIRADARFAAAWTEGNDPDGDDAILYRSKPAMND